MDRITVHPSDKASQRMIVALLLLSIAGVMVYKAFVEGWLAPKDPLDLSNAPVLLFFNRHKGCECEMAVYTAAEKQITEWSAENRRGIPIIPIDLDRRPDLGKQFNIIRAPALLIIDHEEKVLYSQKESQSDTAPLDLLSLDAAVKEIFYGK
jgi:hypothetical protein